MNRPTSFLTTPMAILLGSLVISVAILMHGGIIKIGKSALSVAAQPQVAPSGQQPAQPAIQLFPLAGRPAKRG